jgi:hypothetical protein
LKKIIFGLLFLMLLINAGCTKKNENLNSINNEVFYETKNEEPLITETDEIFSNIYNSENMWLGKTISIAEAENILSSQINSENKNRHLICQSVDFYNGRCYYIFRCFDDFPDHTVTVAWYAVDVLTGECYDTISWVDLEPVN